MKSIRACVIRPNEEPEFIDIESSREYETLRETLGGWLEAAYGLFDEQTGRATVTFWCNEEGKLEGLPVNARATAYWWLVNRDMVNRDVLCGPVVITGFADAQGRTLPLPETMEKIIRETNLEPQ